MKRVFNFDEQLQNNINKINEFRIKNKKNKNSTYDFFSMAVNQKSRISSKISEYESQFNNVLFRLEKEKDEEIKEIEDFCDKNTQIFKGLNSVSYGIRQILSGNVDEVCKNMTYSEIDTELSNLQTAVKNDETNELRDYYSSGEDKVETFDKYIENKGMDIKYDTHSNDYVVNRKLICDGLSELKDVYKSLYDTQNEINKIKESIEKNTEELKQFLQMNLTNSINYEVYERLNSSENKNK